MQELQQTGDDTKLHPAQDPGEERPSIDLAPGSAEEAGNSVTVACPFLMKPEPVWTRSSRKYS